MLPRPAASIHIAVQSHAADAESPAQLRHSRVPVGHRRLREPYLRLRQRELPASPTAPRPRGLQFRHRPLPDARSNSASAAKMPNTRQQAALVVSI